MTSMYTSYVWADSQERAYDKARMGLLYGLEEARKIVLALRIAGDQETVIYAVRHEEVPVRSVRPMVSKRERKARGHA